MVRETIEIHRLQHTYQVIDVTVAVGRAEVPRARRGEDSRDPTVAVCGESRYDPRAPDGTGPSNL